MKNKEITIYELMGLIKDGKAPKKIIYDNRIFIWNKLRILYEGINNIKDIIFCGFFDNLDKKVEILPEENDEWEDIEEIEREDLKKPGENIQFVCNILNQLIKNQKYLKEKLEEK